MPEVLDLVLGSGVLMSSTGIFPALHRCFKKRTYNSSCVHQNSLSTEWVPRCLLWDEDTLMNEIKIPAVTELHSGRERHNQQDKKVNNIIY